ncbi:DUF1266 domain-containing protein [Streptomyces sp. ML-6]|uniref:DUF1266 domain-containing protein n=1 Tax=Streptomyces sp. ML-6 TaxID=2982693 RepID=UPI0024C004BB|nr:DUF1266 domain-containing protein [Streptomyces sp. ML-6]MDK0518021.1 DUF1266 domain-containing protein [Streptomyces sp. ML-6]
MPPTETERLLRESGASGDPGVVLDALSRCRLHVMVARLHADAPGYIAPFPSQHDPVTGRMCVPVLTSGMLPPWHPEWVFRRTTLTELAARWPDNRWRLGVNLATPGAFTLDARPKNRRVWLSADERSAGPPTGRLLTDGGGPLHGPVAYGLAVGAHLAVHNGLVWNRLGAAYADYESDRAWLRNPWGVENRAGHRQTLDALMAARLVGRTHESVLRIRRALAGRLGRTPSLQEWSEGATGALGRRGASATELTEADEALRRVTRYEERFRADGVLAPGGRIDTLSAFDHGRAVNVVRMGLGARYCDPQEAERAVVRIGELARGTYGSWEEFSLGYALTRMIVFDGEDGVEEKYAQSLAQHRVLTQDPTSPYRNIPWS